MIRVLALVMGLVLSGCAGQAGSPPSVQPSATPQATSLISPRLTVSSQSASASPSGAAAVLPLVNGCSETSPCELSPGTWVTAGPFAFIPGLTITLPTPWVSHEQDLGEFRLNPANSPDDQMLMWKDIAAITSDGTTRLVPGIPRTVDGLTEYLKGNSDFVVSKEREVIIASGINARTYVVAVSASARTKDKGCPVFPHCVDLLTDPAHWGPNGAYGIGAPETVRLYLMTVGRADDTHLFVIALDAPNATELEGFTKLALPAISTISLPPVIGNQ